LLALKINIITNKEEQFAEYS